MLFSLQRKPSAIQTLLVLVAIFAIGPLTGCWKQPPERSPVSGDFHTHLVAELSAKSNGSGDWILSTNASSVSYPYGTETVMLCVRVECEDPESLPPFLLLNLTDSEGVIFASSALQKRITDDGNAEFVLDSQGVSPAVQRRELTASFWLLQDDPDQKLVLPVTLVDAFDDQDN